VDTALKGEETIYLDTIDNCTVFPEILLPGTLTDNRLTFYNIVVLL
jgi:hypothetical protein